MKLTIKFEGEIEGENITRTFNYEDRGEAENKMTDGEYLSKIMSEIYYDAEDSDILECECSELNGNGVCTRCGEEYNDDENYLMNPNNR